MPPEQCPECGRFLKNAFVEALTEVGDPCPGCGQMLTSGQFTADVGPAAAAESAPAAPAKQAEEAPAKQAEEAPTARGNADASDADVAGAVAGDQDVLAGWDPEGLDATWRDDQPPSPVDLVAVAAGAAGGGLLGLLVSTRRLRGAVIGAVLGAGVVAAVRRVWELDS